MQIHTRTLNVGETLSITKDLGVYSLSYLVNDSSSGTILGNLSIGGVQSSSVIQSANQGATFTAGSVTSPLEGITINCVSGTIDIVLSVGI
jgi:hypothetical protein